jgi:hypothetical protein
VTNGTQLLPDLDQRTPAARRYRDVLEAIVGDLGGPDILSEGQRQMARRAASLSVSCEQLESKLIGGGPANLLVSGASGGLSPHDILQEAGRILHATARAKGGVNATAASFASLPDAELSQVRNLLVAAADIAHKTIGAGGEKARDLELLAVLSARLTRVFSLLGIRRQARDVGSLQDYLSTIAQEPASAVGVEDATVIAPGDDERAAGHLKAAVAQWDGALPGCQLEDGGDA